MISTTRDIAEPMKPIEPLQYTCKLVGGLKDGYIFFSETLGGEWSRWCVMDPNQSHQPPTLIQLGKSWLSSSIALTLNCYRLMHSDSRYVCIQMRIQVSLTSWLKKMSKRSHAGIIPVWKRCSITTKWYYICCTKDHIMLYNMYVYIDDDSRCNQWFNR